MADKPIDAYAQLVTHEHGYKTKAEVVYGYLKDAILSGTYEPGSRVVLGRVASDLSMSKVPVREAVTRLVGEGWLDAEPHVSPTVPPLTALEIEETAAVRAVIEPGACRLVPGQRPPDNIRRLEELCDRMEEAVGDWDVDYAGLNLQFHMEVIFPCPNTPLRTLAESWMHKSRRYHTVTRAPEHAGATQHEHCTILEAVLAGNSEQVAELTKEHILNAAAVLSDSLQATGPSDGSLE